MLSGYEEYLGSRPELARKDSQTYSVDQHQFSIYFYHHAHTHGSHKLQCRHIRSLLLDVRRVMSWFRSAVTSRTSEARQGWSGICGVSFPLARRVIQVLSLVACPATSLCADQRRDVRVSFARSRDILSSEYDNTAVDRHILLHIPPRCRPRRLHRRWNTWRACLLLRIRGYMSSPRLCWRCTAACCRILVSAYNAAM